MIRDSLEFLLLFGESQVVELHMEEQPEPLQSTLGMVIHQHQKCSSKTRKVANQGYLEAIFYLFFHSNLPGENKLR